MKWIVTFLIFVFAVSANATSESTEPYCLNMGAIRIVTPTLDDFYVNPDARVILRYKLKPKKLVAPVRVQIILDGEHTDTMITNLNINEHSFGILTPGEHTVMLKAIGECRRASTGPITFSVRKPPAMETGNVIQLP